MKFKKLIKIKQKKKIIWIPKEVKPTQWEAAYGSDDWED